MELLKQFANCGKCHLNQNNTCALTQKPIDTNNFCSEFRSHICGCDICGRGILKGAIISGTHIFCSDCIAAAGTCNFCLKNRNCAFNEYNGPLQKIVMIQQRQGNMMFQTQGKNPEVVQQTCGNCQCFLNGNCLRETVNSCENYEELS